MTTDVGTDEEGGGTCRCSVCGRTFDSPEALAVHVREAGLVD
jgi:hypothetical protein